MPEKDTRGRRRRRHTCRGRRNRTSVFLSRGNETGKTIAMWGKEICGLDFGEVGALVGGEGGGWVDWCFGTVDRTHGGKVLGSAVMIE